MRTPEMETERLTFRPMTVKDARSAYENWTSDTEVARFMRWTKHETVEETLAWLEAEQAAAESDAVYSWGLVEKETDVLIGSAGLVWNEEEGLFEPGYNVMKSRWGMGYATEALGCLLRFGTEALGQKRFFCCPAKENPASGRVLEKTGFRYRGDGVYYSWDGSNCFAAREYILDVE